MGLLTRATRRGWDERADGFIFNAEESMRALCERFLLLTLSIAAVTVVSGCDGSSTPSTPLPPRADGGTENVAFPLSVSRNGRYLQDQNGVPFRVHGDTAWDASVSVTLSDWRTYLDDRKARGFNTILVQITNPARYVESSTAPASKGAGGALPFQRNAFGGTWDGDPGFANMILGGGGTPRFDADFSSPNPAYFDWIDTMLGEAESRRMLVVLTACYLGYNLGAKDGWWQTLNNSANTQQVSYGFGQYLGNRYKAAKNILWQMGVDMRLPADSEGTARALKILEGVKAAGDTHLWTGQWSHDYLSTDDPTFAGHMDVEGVYTHGLYPALGPTYPLSRLGYARTPPRPTVLLETTYEGGYDASAVQIRGMMWGAQLSTIGGVIFGNLPIWNFGTGWKGALSGAGSRAMDVMDRLLDQLPWHELVPSALGGMRRLITAGEGTPADYLRGRGATGGEDWVVAAATPDGRALVAYVPDAHRGPFTVDTTALAEKWRARWYDPTNGAFVVIGNFAHTGTQEFSIPGRNADGTRDWVLLIDGLQ